MAWWKRRSAEYGERSTEHGARSTEHGARSTEHGARSTEHGVDFIYRLHVLGGSVENAESVLQVCLTVLQSILHIYFRGMYNYIRPYCKTSVRNNFSVELQSQRAMSV